jgi:hypothetical protein
MNVQGMFSVNTLVMSAKQFVPNKKGDSGIMGSLLLPE